MFIAKLRCRAQDLQHLFQHLLADGDRRVNGFEAGGRSGRICRGGAARRPPQADEDTAGLIVLDGPERLILPQPGED